MLRPCAELLFDRVLRPGCPVQHSCYMARFRNHFFSPCPQDFIGLLVILYIWCSPFVLRSFSHSFQHAMCSKIPMLLYSFDFWWSFRHAHDNWYRAYRILVHLIFVACQLSHVSSASSCWRKERANTKSYCLLAWESFRTARNIRLFWGNVGLAKDWGWLAKLFFGWKMLQPVNLEIQYRTFLTASPRFIPRLLRCHLARSAFQRSMTLNQCLFWASQMKGRPSGQQKVHVRSAGWAKVRVISEYSMTRQRSDQSFVSIESWRYVDNAVLVRKLEHEFRPRPLVRVWLSRRCRYGRWIADITSSHSKRVMPVMHLLQMFPDSGICPFGGLQCLNNRRLAKAHQSRSSRHVYLELVNSHTDVRYGELWDFT